MWPGAVVVDAVLVVVERRRQVGEQPSSSVTLPSSHSSVPARYPSPQAVAPHAVPGIEQVHPGSRAQAEEHPSPDAALPSSHCSVPVMTPSPHTMVETHGEPGVGQAKLASMALQSRAQPSPGVMLPSSHTSPGSMMRSPHTAAFGGAMHPASPPASQSRTSMQALPKAHAQYGASTWQVAEQPSPGTVLPSSQLSPTPASLSPHTAGGRHAAGVASQSTGAASRTEVSGAEASGVEPNEGGTLPPSSPPPPPYTLGGGSLEHAAKTRSAMAPPQRTTANMGRVRMPGERTVVSRQPEARQRRSSGYSYFSMTLGSAAASARHAAWVGSASSWPAYASVVDVMSMS